MRMYPLLLLILFAAGMAGGSEAVKKNVDLSSIGDYENEVSAAEITEAMKKAVPTFYSPERVNAEAEKSKEMQIAMS